jgi:catechol 2,3-dioxygenase
MPDSVAAERRAGVATDPIRIGAVSLTVRDLETVAGFYRDAIGLREIARSPDRVSLGAEGTACLTLVHRPDALPDDPATAGLFHTAFLLPSRADLADWLVHVSAHRVPLDGASDHRVSEAIYLSDPEGNGVEVCADRPRAAWRWEAGQVAMSTDRLDVSALIAERSAVGWLGAPAGARIGHVHLRVGDVARAVRFWTEDIGLDLVSGRHGAAFLSSGGYHHHIAANIWQSAGAGPRDPLRAGLVAVTLETADPARKAITDPWGTEIRFVARQSA